MVRPKPDAIDAGLTVPRGSRDKVKFALAGITDALDARLMA